MYSARMREIDERLLEIEEARNRQKTAMLQADREYNKALANAKKYGI
jgi:hypothetical protein